jgi:23S rRNA pseudouridine1911/1915/1917 synthase
LLHAVTAEEAGKRADVVVARLSGASRSQVADAVARGEVRINGVAGKAARLLSEGEWLEFEIPALPQPTAQPEAIALDVVFEDGDAIVVNKPAGMVTHPAHRATHGTLLNALLAHVGGPLPGDELRAGLVHRLDRDTSGLLVVAKNAFALSALARDMKARRIAREYLGLVCGIPEAASGTISGAIGRDPRNRLRFAIVSDGKPAITHYTVREAFTRHAELAFQLETGRTHQIRVHVAAMRHPIVNDPVYGRPDERAAGMPGQALHAWRLSFAHPRTRELLTFEAPPPPAYAALRRQLSDGG